MNSKLAFIDFYRGVAILLVISVHTIQRFPNVPVIFDAFYLGQYGVQLFFILSSFTLCISLTSRDEKFLFYSIRRTFRIAPLYYFGIFLYFALYKAAEYIGFSSDAIDNYNIINVLFNIFFIHTFHEASQNTIVPGGWSIGVEMVFYLVFPLVMKLYTLKGLQGIKILFIVVVFFNFLNITHASNLGEEIKNNSFHYYVVWNQLPVFLIGIFTYDLYLRSYDLKKTQLILLALTSFSLTIFFHYNENLFKIGLLPITTGVFFSCLILLTYNFKFNLPLIKSVGERSFSMYILHFIFTLFLLPILSLMIDLTWLVFIPIYIFICVLTYFSAFFTYSYIEKNMMAFTSYFISILKNNFSKSSKS